MNLFNGYLLKNLRMVVAKLTPVITFMFSEMLYSSVNATKKLTE